MFFGYGVGANGKGVFLHTIGWVLGEYCKTAAIETFTESKSDRHPTELARLRGARLVTATETESGRNWAEARIKMLTGGDVVTAQFKADGTQAAGYAGAINQEKHLDIDQAWRFTVTGVAVACDWFKLTPRQYADRLDKQVSALETEAGREMAAQELVRTRAELMLHLI